LPRIQPDQAEGLRRMLTPDNLRVVTLLSGKHGVGKTTVATNLALALTRSGRDVLLVDENHGAGNVAAALDLQARFDLTHVIAGSKRLDEVMLAGPEGIAVLPAAHGAQALPAAESAAGVHLAQAFAAYPAPVDYVLVDTAAGMQSNLLALDVDNQEVVIVLSRAASSITESYALVKMMNQRYGQRHFHVLVNRVATEQEAGVIFQNMAGAARGFLAVTLDFMGYVPPDESVWQARQLRRCALDLFPGAPAAASYRQLAESITEWPAPRESVGGLEGYLQRLIRGRSFASATPMLRASNSK
jgi:flagellar biosynthesis protein FlhG